MSRCKTRSGRCNGNCYHRSIALVGGVAFAVHFVSLLIDEIRRGRISRDESAGEDR